MSTEWVNWPIGVGRRIFQEIDSTNAEAHRRAKFASGPEWLLALRQLSGRGRRGRAWADPPGNFAATYLMRLTGPMDQLALRSFVASLALFDALVAATGRSDCFSLKWPNDILLNGGKLAGILLESISSGTATQHLAIGIGINLITAPGADEVEQIATLPVSLLSETGALTTPPEFLALLAPAYAKWEHQFTTFGFSPIRDTWLSRAARLGQDITARIGTTEIKGRFETIDSCGQLILSTASGRQAISAADIFF